MIKLVQTASSLPVCITLSNPIITSDPKQPQGANLVSDLPDQNAWIYKNTKHELQDAQNTGHKMRKQNYINTKHKIHNANR